MSKASSGDPAVILCCTAEKSNAGACSAAMLQARSNGASGNPLRQLGC